VAAFRIAAAHFRGQAWLALALALAAGMAGAPHPASAAPDRPQTVRVGAVDTYTFAFHDAAVGQVADEILGRTLGLNFTVDPDVTAKISFRIDQRLTRAQLLEAFEAALAANGVVMVRNGESLVLTSRSKAKESAAIRPQGETGAGAGFEVVAVPLTFATPSEVGKALQSMGHGDMVVYTDDKLGLLLLGGSPHELETIEQMLKVLDQSGLQSSRIRWFELDKAAAQTFAQELTQILQASGVAGVTLVPLKRLNGILVFARTPRALDAVGEWIAKLDVPSKEEAPELWVYRPQSIAADALASTLNSVLGSGPSDSGAAEAPSGPSPANDAPTKGGATSAPPSSSSGTPSSAPMPFTPSGDNNVRIGVSKDTNTLIITATPSKWLQIRRIVEEIDRTPRQVLIEASILEVTLSNDLEGGVDWSVLADHGKLNIASIGNAAGAVAPSYPGFAATYLGKDIQVAINALKSVTEVEVVSAPKLMTLDNHVAKLLVGDQVPISTKSAQSTETANAPLVTTTEYRDTGVILSVTPRISGEDEVVLDIDQQISSVAKTTSSGIDSPTIQQRHLQSTLICSDGQAIALGGLISDNRSKGHAGPPIIQDLPLIGHALRSNTVQGNRTELIILITAKVMKDAASRERVSKDLLEDVKEIGRRGLLSR
jgi:general secretion pathway protein D